MRYALATCLACLCAANAAFAQTADELVAKNTAAKGGIEKIKAIRTLRMTGRLQQGDFSATIGQEQKAPNLLRSSRFGLALTQPAGK